MVNDMLEYSLRPEALTNNRENVDLKDLLQKTILMMGVEDDVEIILPDTSGVLKTSEIALQQIFINLLTNAIRYNDKSECKIEISCSSLEDRIIFQVADNGPGIAPEQLERIFEKDVTLGITDRFNQKGTGLGLHTVKLLIEKLGGTIDVISEIGRGSKFIFALNKGL